MDVNEQNAMLVLLEIFLTEGTFPLKKCLPFPISQKQTWQRDYRIITNCLNMSKGVHYQSFDGLLIAGA